MKYKNLLYRLSSLFSPNFYKEISDLLSEKNSITIFDIGFYSGDFTIKLVQNLDEDVHDKNISIYSFDPNRKIDRADFIKFAKSENIHWEHFDYAIGDKNSTENFTVLKHFPSSGSSVNNILIDSIWLKTRSFIFSPFTKKDNITETFEVNQKTLDSINFNLKSLDILKIDVEGYSYNVLLGAKKTILKFSPVIQLELLSHKKSFGNSREQIIQYLENLGYKLIGEKKHYTTHIFSDVICVDMLFNK